MLVARAELRPTQALVLFWWANFDARLHILRRFAVDRSVLIQELGEVFALAAAEGWSDADTRKTLQVIERRQRNRAAAAQSPYGSLEGALAAGRARARSRAGQRNRASCRREADDGLASVRRRGRRGDRRVLQGGGLEAAR